jgi:hypothetical protein
MTDAERVLAMLIHDVRTPLGVAHGYLRLVRGDKLPAAADRDRALASTQDALARVSRLCQDAGTFLEDPPGPDSGRVAAAQLAERVAGLLAERGLDAPEPLPAAGTVAVGPSVDRAAEAIATLLAARAGKTPGDVVTMEDLPGTLRFACWTGSRDGFPGTVAEAGEPFDPWKTSHGLSVIAAHRTVVALGGRVWSGDNGLALALAMPMETGKE